MSAITADKFSVTSEDYDILDREFGELCQYQGWQLIKRNSKNNHTDDQEDVAQEMRMSLIIAATYHKRQVYIKNCLELCDKYVDDVFCRKVLKHLSDMWFKRTKDGSKRKKFGQHQEEVLDNLLHEFVPDSEKPEVNAPLDMNGEFSNYAKSVTWNRQKTLGKKITKEKGIRTGLVSMSEYDFC